jgi:hypothetical protein
MLNDDPTCFYLSESVKPDAEAIFRERGCGDLFKVIREAAQPMATRWSRLKRSLERAATTGSRMTREVPPSRRIA